MMMEFFHHRTMPNAGPTEYNAVFHPAFNDAAIGHKRIGNGGGKTVFHRDLILHAGVNGTVHGEQRLRTAGSSRRIEISK